MTNVKNKISDSERSLLQQCQKTTGFEFVRLKCFSVLIADQETPNDAVSEISGSCYEKYKSR